MPAATPIPIAAAYSRTRLEDRVSHICGAALMRMLDRYCQDPVIHAAMIERLTLPEAVVARLLALLPAALIPSLVSRHPLPHGLLGETAKQSRDRPEWWQAAHFNRVP